MLNQKQAKKLAIEEYKKLWGPQILTEKSGTLSSCYGMHDENVYMYSIDQDELLAAAPTVWDGNDISVDESSLPDHRTTFYINLKTGDIKVVEHY